MTQSVQQKIDTVLDRIHDPQTGLSLLSLGLVERIRLVEEKKKLIVVLARFGRGKVCCSVLNLAMLADFERQIREGLEEQFPGFSVAFTDAVD